MNTDDIPTAPVAEWQPMQEQFALAVLGKLGEEAAELATACFRCIIQGLDEAEPKTGKINREWLQEELADVSALVHFAVDLLTLDKAAISERAKRKVAYKAPWFDSLRGK